MHFQLVRQYNCRTNDTTREAESYAALWNSKVVSITSSIPISHNIPQLTPGKDMLNSPIFCLLHYLYRSALIATFSNKQCIAFVYYCINLLYEYMFINDMLHPYTLVRPIRQGLKYPTVWCEKSEHFHKCGTPNL